MKYFCTEMIALQSCLWPQVWNFVRDTFAAWNTLNFKMFSSGIYIRTTKIYIELMSNKVFCIEKKAYVPVMQLSCIVWIAFVQLRKNNKQVKHNFKLFSFVMMFWNCRQNYCTYGFWCRLVTSAVPEQCIFCGDGLWCALYPSLFTVVMFLQVL